MLYLHSFERYKEKCLIHIDLKMFCCFDTQEVVVKHFLWMLTCSSSHNYGLKTFRGSENDIKCTSWANIKPALYRIWQTNSDVRYGTWKRKRVCSLGLKMMLWFKVVVQHKQENVCLHHSHYLTCAEKLLSFCNSVFFKRFYPQYCARTKQNMILWYTLPGLKTWSINIWYSSFI